MIKKICFFSIGFAFNRLVRLKFYEKIFPKNVKIFLFTTDKYAGKEKQSYQYEWDGLKRTKIVQARYNPLTLPFALRRFCKENKIDRVINIGNFYGGLALIPATILSKTDYELNILADVFDEYKARDGFCKKLFSVAKLPLLYPAAWFANRVMFTGKTNYERANVFFLAPKSKMRHLAAPVNLDLFKPKDKKKSRKKSKLPMKKKIIVFVGRVNYEKGSDILTKLIRSNPGIHFIVIGKAIDKEFINLQKSKIKNLQYIEKKSSKELVDYYSASDLSFCINRGGGGIGISSEEALACGVPILVSKQFKLKNSDALLQTSLNFKQVNKAVKGFFKVPEKNRKKLSKIARKYVQENYSDKVWKNKYIEAYLN